MAKIIRLLFVATIVTLCQSYRLFLMGGAIKSNNSQLYNALAKATRRTPTPNKCAEDWGITTCPKIAVVTSAAASVADGDNAYGVDQPDSPSYYTLFRMYGMAPLHISAHIDNFKTATNASTLEGNRNLQIMLQADIVFFNGGDQSRHARTWLTDTGDCNAILCQLLDRYRRDDVIWSGTSAGTLIMNSPTYGQGIPYGHLYFAYKVGLAPKPVSEGGVNGTGLKDTRNGTSSLQYSDNGGFMDGFSATGGMILPDAHFDARGRLARIVPAMKQFKMKSAVGVDEDTAFFIDGNTGYTYGRNGVFFVDTNNATFPQGDYFSARDVRVTYMTSGDKFNVTTKEVMSSKPEIKTPYYTNYTDSSDITAAYQCTLLITRLVDQKSSTNYGRTKIPSGYPSNAPKFQLAFTKDSLTKGYYGSRMYTADKVIMNIGAVAAFNLRMMQVE